GGAVYLHSLLDLHSLLECPEFLRRRGADGRRNAGPGARAPYRPPKTTFGRAPTAIPRAASVPCGTSRAYIAGPEEVCNSSDSGSICWMSRMRSVRSMK